MGNFHPFEVVARASETQLQVGENLNKSAEQDKGLIYHPTIRSIYRCLWRHAMYETVQLVPHPLRLNWSGILGGGGRTPTRKWRQPPIVSVAAANGPRCKCGRRETMAQPCLKCGPKWADGTRTQRRVNDERMLSVAGGHWYSWLWRRVWKLWDIGPTLGRKCLGLPPSVGPIYTVPTAQYLEVIVFCRRSCNVESTTCRRLIRFVQPPVAQLVIA